MTTNEAPRPATREQAEAVLRMVKAKYAAYLKTFAWDAEAKCFDFDHPVDVPESEQPQVFMGWGDDGATVIAWENNSPHDWALCDLTEASIDPELAGLARDAGASRKLAASIGTSQGAKGSMPKGVYTDTYFSFVLAVYQED